MDKEIRKDKEFKEFWGRIKKLRNIKEIREF